MFGVLVQKLHDHQVLVFQSVYNGYVVWIDTEAISICFHPSLTYKCLHNKVDLGYQQFVIYIYQERTLIVIPVLE